MTPPLPTATAPKTLLVAALTPDGARLAARLTPLREPAELWLPAALAPDYPGAHPFDRVSRVFREAGERGGDLICIMAAGIVVRQIAPYLQHKARDPAVVVLDEAGRFAISLLSGHLGGANELARRAAALVGATPVITTATDVHGLPALDSLAARLDLGIDRLEAVRPVHMALLTGKPVRLLDPEGVVTEALEDWQDELITVAGDLEEALAQPGPAVYVGVAARDFPADWLVLRPRLLVVGVGCNKGTAAAEIRTLISDALAQAGLSAKAIRALASIAAKRREPGLRAAARELGVETIWFTAEELKGVSVPHPSEVVARHMGVASVCEAAALRAAGNGTLLVPKRKSTNATVAVAKAGWPSSA